MFIKHEFLQGFFPLRYANWLKEMRANRFNILVSKSYPLMVDHFHEQLKDEVLPRVLHRKHHITYTFNITKNMINHPPLQLDLRCIWVRIKYYWLEWYLLFIAKCHNLLLHSFISFFFKHEFSMLQKKCCFVFSILNMLRKWHTKPLKLLWDLTRRYWMKWSTNVRNIEVKDKTGPIWPKIYIIQGCK